MHENTHSFPSGWRNNREVCVTQGCLVSLLGAKPFLLVATPGAALCAAECSCGLLCPQALLQGFEAYFPSVTRADQDERQSWVMLSCCIAGAPSFPNAAPQSQASAFSPQCRGNNFLHLWQVCWFSLDFLCSSVFSISSHLLISHNVTFFTRNLYQIRDRHSWSWDATGSLYPCFLCISNQPCVCLSV